jgi:hypothetical protein
VVEGFRYTRAGDTDALATLDGQLARIAPGDPLFAEASRMRIQWRLDRGGPEAAAEAQEIAEILLRRRWVVHDSLLRATAAIAANRPQEAWASLERVGTAGRGPQARSNAARALALARQLPEAVAGDLPERLAARASGRELDGGGRDPAEVDSPAMEGTAPKPR